VPRAPEIVGPIDISKLREGRYIRREQGKLPTARLGFLDEIFKSNSAILNILLTIINERKFYQDGVPQPVRLRVLFAATNEVPEQADGLLPLGVDGVEHDHTWVRAGQEVRTAAVTVDVNTTARSTSPG